jgi:hypothetical protein
MGNWESINNVWVFPDNDGAEFILPFSKYIKNILS